MRSDTPWSPWGEVPADGEVVPFSHADPVRSDRDRTNKRHHFVSATYMNGFADAGGKVWVYRSEVASDPLHMRPASVGHERYYYSQKLPEGGQENHRFEDLWCAIEEIWPATLRAIRDRRLSPAISFNVLGMASIMRTRVPAARDRNTLLMAAELRAGMRALERIGKLPTEYAIYAGKLDRVPVGIDPQRTLRTISADLKSFGNLCFRLGFEVVHNTSSTAFVTSDNPVCFYDPTDTVQTRTPYNVGRHVELVFPLDARTLLRGSTRLVPVNQVIRHKTLCDAASVRRLNRTIAQFGYRFFLASDRSCDDLARVYADRCPTVEIDVGFEGEGGREVRIVWRHVFGPRPPIPTYVDTPEKAARVQAAMEAEGLVQGSSAS